MDLGDILIKFNDELLLLFERKTIKDLASSIKSGRYKEQKLRIINSDVDISKILYLIEGNINPQEKIEKIPYQTLIGSFINLIVRDNIKMFQSQNLKET